MTRLLSFTLATILLSCAHIASDQIRSMKVSRAIRVQEGGMSEMIWGQSFEVKDRQIQKSIISSMNHSRREICKFLAEFAVHIEYTNSEKVSVLVGRGCMKVNGETFVLSENLIEILTGAIPASGNPLTTLP